MATKLVGSVELKRIHEFLSKALISSDLVNYSMLIDNGSDSESFKITLSELLSFTTGGSSLPIVKVSDIDNTAGYLYEKISVGGDIVKTIVNSGGNETLELSVTGTSKPYQLWQPDGTDPFVYTDNGGALHIDGNVAIGTSDTTNLLTANKSVSGSLGGIIEVANRATTAAGGAVELRLSPSSAASRYCSIQAINTNGDNIIDLSFITGSGSTITEKMIITGGGNVGIGIKPAVRLHAAIEDGTVYADNQAFATNTLSKVQNTSNVTNTAAYFDILAGASYGSATRLATINVGGATSSASDFSIMLRKSAGSVFSERFRINGETGSATFSNTVTATDFIII